MGNWKFGALNCPTPYILGVKPKRAYTRVELLYFEVADSLAKISSITAFISSSAL
ncbi:hypothetical protein SAMN05661096_03637 [Marivirga sericea]|uniref:Uncharacterized protein n=1 Tax=Marivirga sericea TaxID=1028 RepID=A0A1X7LAC1_9BACT|nr:hypothetical protein SAMN05661096_03637 [Marivirga sericea]